MVILVAIGSDNVLACACHPLTGQPALGLLQWTSPRFATILTCRLNLNKQ